MPLERLAQERVHAEQVQQVIHHSDDQHAEHGAHHRAFAAGHARTAHDDCGDCIELVAVAGICRVHRADARNLQKRCDRDDGAHQRINAELDAVDVDAGEPRRFFIRADRKHVAAENGFLRDDVQNHCEQQPVENRHQHLPADLDARDLEEIARHLR